MPSETLRSLSHARLKGRHRHCGFEPLEERRLLAYAISGAVSATEGVPYALALHRSETGSIVEHWTINWGDNSPAEVVPGNPKSVSHVYANGPAVAQISATATDQTGTFAAIKSNRVTITALDAAFGSQGEIRIGTPAAADAFVGKLLLQADGKIIAIGMMNSGSLEPKVARFLPDGTLDASFGNRGVVTFSWVNTDEGAIDPAGRILLSTEHGIARLLPSGQLDQSFGNHGIAEVGSYPSCFAVDSQSRVVFYAGYERSRVGRLLNNGAIDPNFRDGPAPINSPWAIAIDELNRPVFTTGHGDILVWRLDQQGEVDNGFGVNGFVSVDMDGRDEQGRFVEVWQSKIIVGATSQVPGSLDNDLRDIGVVRLNADGSLDSTFSDDGKLRVDLGGFEEPRGMFVRNDGSIFLSGDSGNFDWVEVGPEGQVVRAAFDGPLHQYSGILATTDGHVLLGGNLRLTNGHFLYAIAEYADEQTPELSFGLSDGDGRAGVASLAFGSGATEAAYDIVNLPNGGLLVGTWGGDSVSSSAAVLRYRADGTLDTNFGTSGSITIEGPESGSLGIDEPGPMNELRGIAVDAAGRILVLVQHYEGDPGSLYRYLADGTPDNSFGADAGNAVPLPILVLDSLAISPTGEIVVGGRNVQPGPHREQFALAMFDGETGAPRAEFGEAGILYADFHQPNNSLYETQLRDLAFNADGNLVALVALQGFGLAVARYLPAGTLDPAFGIGSSPAQGTTLENQAGLTALGLDEWWVDGSIALDSVGRIVGTVNQKVFRLTRGGALDASFSGDGLASAPFETRNVAIDLFDRPLIVGVNGVMRLTTSGAADTTFAASGWLSLPKKTLNVAAVEDSGALLVAGKMTGPDITDDIYVARYLPADPQLLVNVANAAPQALAGDDQELDEGELATLHGAALEQGPVDTLSYSWRVVNGVGQLVAAGLGADWSFVLPEEGAYVATLTVTDNDGARGSDTLTVTARHVPDPTLECSLQVGASMCVVHGGKPGATVQLLAGVTPGEKVLNGATIDMLDGQVVASGVVSDDGTTSIVAQLTQEQLDSRVLLQAMTQSLVARVTNVVIVGEPLRATSEGHATVETLQLGELAAVRAVAIAYWETAGLSLADSLLLRGAVLSVTDLPADVLGQTIANQIYIDENAAGHGWFVDPTPRSASEYSAASPTLWRAPAASSAFDRADLLTAVLHEMGHLLGRSHTPTADALMAKNLALGTRELPAGVGPVFDGHDVSRDGLTTPLDALLIINRLNAAGPGRATDSASLVFDVDFSGQITPLDVLLVINRLNSGAGAAGEDSSPPVPMAEPQSLSSPADDTAFYFYDWWWPKDEK
jgi:uncharacterized delta-60 repeat protein